MSEISITIPLKALVMSPVHIGTGDSIDPFSYVIRDSQIYHFDFMDFCSSLSTSGLSELTRISREPTALDGIRKYINRMFNPETVRHESRPFSLSDANIGRDGIRQMFYDGGVPKIPGSSLKGSIRTALLQHAIDKGYISARDTFTGTQDPFKILSVNDFSSNKTKVTYGCYDYYVKDTVDLGSKSNLAMIAEIIAPKQLLSGSVTVRDYLYQADTRNKELALMLRDVCSSKKQLLSVINKHYGELFERESKPLEASADVAESSFLKQKRATNKDMQSMDAAFIKVGWHSGSMGTTYSKEYREIWSHGQKVKEPSKLWYFSDKVHRPSPKINTLYPCGWVVLF